MNDQQKMALLKAKGRLLWRLINQTPGVADLASHMEKETPFDKLPRDEQVTALAIVRGYEEGARIVEEEAARRWQGQGAEEDKPQVYSGGKAEVIEGEVIASGDIKEETPAPEADPA